MKIISKALITATIAVTLVGATLPLTATSAEAGPKSVSGLDLGSGRLWGW